MPTPSEKHRGWSFDRANSRLNAVYNGDPSFYVDANGLTVPSGETLAVAGSLTPTGAVDMSGATVTLPTRTAVIDLEPFLLGADGAALAATETAGDFYRPVGTNQLWINGEVSISETEVSVGYCTFTLPENYLAAGTITLRAWVDVQGAGTLGTCTVDFEAYLMAKADGSVGSDLVTTAATAVSATGAAKDFVVTPTGLAAGDKLVVKLTTSIAESAGSDIHAVITQLAAVVQVNK